MNHQLGRLLVATGVFHALVGVTFFREPLAAIFADGFFDAIAIPGSLTVHPDRMAAMWFLVPSPLFMLLGQIVNRALGSGDWAVLRIIGWHLLGLGVVGVAMLPISGFWILIVLGPLFVRAAREMRTPLTIMRPS